MTASAPTIHVASMCAHCGQIDDHPKLVVGSMGGFDGFGAPRPIVDYHHDCAPMPLLASILGGAHGVHALVTAKIFKAAQDGTRGDDLREFIAAPENASMRDMGDATMLKYTTYANDVIDSYLPNGATGTFVIGATTYTLPFKIRWLSTLSVAATPGTEWSGGSYPAGGVALNGQLTSAASGAAKASTGALTTTNSPATTWADNDIRDATGTPKNVVFKGTPSLAKTVNSGDTATIPIGSLTGAET